ncbi:MAG: glycine zipper 2TM domain-containing protein [Pseudoxanthomonas sp.]
MALAGCVLLAGCATTPSPRGYGGSAPPAPRYCQDCGIVTRIDTVPAGRSAPAATGAVLGGIVGAVAGRQISKDNSYDVTVRMDDGRTVVVRQNDLGGIRENTYVRIVNGRAAIR